MLTTTILIIIIVVGLLWLAMRLAMLAWIALPLILFVWAVWTNEHVLVPILAVTAFVVGCYAVMEVVELVWDWAVKRFGL